MARARPYDRDAALDAAQALFWRKGYHATSLKDLEAALNMRPGSIYAAFSSKEALYGLALERYYQKNSAQFRAMVEGAETPLTGLVAFLRGLADVSAGDPQCRACMLVKTLLTATEADAAIAAQAEDYLERMEAAMEEMFQRAQARGEIAADADCRRLARRFQSDVTALKIAAQRGVAQEELAQMADDAAQYYEGLRLPRH